MDVSVEAGANEPEPEVAPPAKEKAVVIEIPEVEYDGSSHAYYIQTTAANGEVAFALRRYSEFDTLREILATLPDLPGLEVTAPFPEKFWFGSTQAGVVAERKTKLCDWLNALLALSPPPPGVASFLEHTPVDKAKTAEVLARFADPLIAQKLMGTTDDEYVQYAVPHGADGKHYATAKDACLTVEVAKTGVASRKGTTVPKLFEMAKNIGGDNRALWWEDPADQYAIREWTWKEYYDDTMAAARSLIALGVEPFSSVSIIGFNSPHWHMACLGAIAAGAKAAGVYATNEPSAVQYIVEHSESVVCVCENAAQMDKFTKSGILEQLPKLTALVQYLGDPPETSCGKVKLLNWAQFLELGAQDEALVPALKERVDAQEPGHCCSLIYTSGTTGNPKAVMISHDNACWTSMAFLSNEPEIAKPGSVHTIVSYLPLSHIAAQALDIIFPIVGTAGLGEGESRSFQIQTFFARPDALRGSLKDTLAVARPTIFFAVPRVWEKFAEVIKQKGKALQGTFTGSVSAWAKGKVSEAYHESQAGGHAGYTPFMHTLASGIVGKAREALGLDRCDFLYTGAAPITRETLEYFGSLGIKILELYGMSENTGPMTVSNARPDGSMIGSAGLPLAGCQIKIEHMAGRDKPGEGEICMRGRHVMMGYLKEEEKTAEAIDDIGFLHSGDVGRIDRFGLLHITGRIKELIITAGGENVAPVPCEDAIKLHANGALSNVVMIGDKMKYNSCLVTLRQKEAPDGTFLPELAGVSADFSPASTTVEQAMADPKWIAMIQQAIQTYNSVDAVSNAAKVQRFAILTTDFEPVGEDAELTATLKLKRPVVVRKHAAVIDGIYAGTSGHDVSKRG